VSEGRPVQPPRPDLESDELAASWREFRSTGEEAVEIAAELTPDQLWWRPAPERWSVGGCLDHLVRTGEVYLEALDEAIDEGRRRGLRSDGPGRRSVMGRWLVRFLDPPPGLPVPAPGRIRPRDPETDGSGTDGDGDPLSDFLALRPELADRLQAADGLDLGRIRLASPFAWFLTFDLGSAFRIVAAHERRHLWQARRVCEAEGFPRR
jgi:hypothetical protein